jgi:hypothetical protein
MVLVKKLIALALVIGSLVLTSVGCGPPASTGKSSTSSPPASK